MKVNRNFFFASPPPKKKYIYKYKPIIKITLSTTLKKIASKKTASRGENTLNAIFFSLKICHPGQSQMVKSFVKYPSHTKLILTLFRKFLSNRLELCSDKVDVKATFDNLFMNLMDRLEWIKTGRVLQNFEPAQNFLPSIPSYNKTGVTTY